MDVPRIRFSVEWYISMRRFFEAVPTGPVPAGHARRGIGARTDGGESVIINVNGMHCPSCEIIIKESLEEAGATRVIADHKKGTVRLEGIPLEKAKRIIETEGYAAK